MTRVSKAIPRANAPIDERRAMRDERAARYPEIPLMPSGMLAAGPDDPTDEDLWGDPVNLSYPLAYTGQRSPDRARAANARARFQQAGGRYPGIAAQRAVYSRIVQGVIDAGVAEPSFDASNRFDALLPDDIVSQITDRDKAARGTTMNKFEHALRGFQKSMGESAPTVQEIMDEIHELVDMLCRLGHEHASQLLTMVKSVVHEAGVGDPASLGLMVDDRSGDPNYSPVAGITRPELRVGANAMARMTIGEAVALAPNPVPNPFHPALETTPGPRVPAPLPRTNGDISMPPPSIASTTGREVDGVTKEMDFDDFILAAKG